jgi:hypothetical protein
MPGDLLEERHLLRSAVRHRPIVPDAINTQVKTPRGSRAKKQREPHTTGGPPLVVPAHKSKGGTWLIYLVLGMVISMVLLWIGQLIWDWGQTVSDDFRYGRPRTTSVDQFVGHETGKTPSHFIAQNQKGQVYIIEIPGGQADHSHLLIGPHLYGPGSDLAVVTLSFVGDVHHPDLLVRVNNIQILFHNTGTTYAPTS